MKRAFLLNLGSDRLSRDLFASTVDETERSLTLVRFTPIGIWPLRRSIVFSTAQMAFQARVNLTQH